VHRHLVRWFWLLSPWKPKWCAELPQPVPALRVELRPHPEVPRLQLHELDPLDRLDVAGRSPGRGKSVLQDQADRGPVVDLPDDGGDADEEEERGEDQDGALLRAAHLVAVLGGDPDHWGGYSAFHLVPHVVE